MMVTLTSPLLADLADLQKSDLQQEQCAVCKDNDNMLIIKNGSNKNKHLYVIYGCAEALKRPSTTLVLSPKGCWRVPLCITCEFAHGSNGAKTYKRKIFMSELGTISGSSGGFISSIKSLFGFGSSLDTKEVIDAQCIREWFDNNQGKELIFWVHDGGWNMHEPLEDKNTNDCLWRPLRGDQK